MGARWPVLYTIIGVGICAACLVLARFLLQPPVIVVNGGKDFGGNHGTGEHPGEQPGKRAGSDEHPVTPPRPAGPDWPKVAAQLKGAVLLIQVERDAAAWPVATCCAIRDNTVLATATTARVLAMFRENKFQVWVTDPGGQTKVEVGDIRIPADFQAYAGKPDQPYYDLALLEVRGTLAKLVPLASEKELGALEEGLPVACFGFSPKPDKITRFDRFEPQLTPAKIFLVKSPPPHAADGPRALDLTAVLPENAFGSPVVNDQGKVLAVCLEAAGAKEAARPKGTVPISPDENRDSPLKDLHPAVVVNLRLIGAWLEGHDTQAWISPSATSDRTSSPPEGSSPPSPRP